MAAVPLRLATPPGDPPSPATSGRTCRACRIPLEVTDDRVKYCSAECRASGPAEPEAPRQCSRCGDACVDDPDRRVTLCDACRGLPALKAAATQKPEGSKPGVPNLPDLSTRVALTIDEAAAALGCTRPHIYKLKRRHGLPVARLATKPVIPVRELRDWLAGQLEGGAR